MIFEIAMIALAVYYFSKDPSHLKDWERQFIDEYGEKGKLIISFSNGANSYYDNYNVSF